MNGPLTINGSITGQGSLYVTGKSSFQGSASVTTARPDKVALYSHGSVEIKGFDGTAFLNAAGSDPALSGFSYNQHLNNFRSDLTELANEFADPNAVWGQNSKADNLRANIGRGQATLPTQFLNDPNTNLSRNLGYMIGLLPPSSAQGPLQKKFDDITGIFTGTLNYDDQSLAALDRAKADRLENYSIDNIIDFELYEHRPAMEAMIRGMNFDRPGETFFQGLVYTHGYIHASQEVTIVGGVAAVQSSSGPPVPTEVVDGDTLNPGDVYLLDGSRLLYVEDFFNPTAVHPGAGGEGTSVHLWMGR